MFNFIRSSLYPGGGTGQQLPPINALDVLRVAQGHVEKGEFDKALVEFDKLCNVDVQSPLPYLSRATCHLQLKNYKKAIVDCEKVLTFLNTDVDEKIAEGCTTLHSVALLRLAKAHKELGDMEACKSAMTRRNAIEHKKGKSGAAAGDGDGGEEMTAEAEQTIADEWRERGNICYKDGEWSKALQFYKQGLSFNVYDSKLHGNACMALIKLRRFDQALKHADQCISLEPDWVKGYYLKAQILSEQSKLGPAEAELQKALKKDSSNAAIKNLLDDIQQRKSNTLRKRGGKGTSSTPELGKKALETDPILDLKKVSRLDPTPGSATTADGASKPELDGQEDSVEDDEDAITFSKIYQRVATRENLKSALIDLIFALVGIGIVWFIVSKS
ncbi:hypothetical protein H4219_003447 [Mycoemilia scoparia]|uniref:Uncharacterized protein n=1 Tax=Mycoemilia scoparia TaxID=417184 RepID=A0A9W8A472_9FUNG|nr:hypothetical protein H4219_003447 [Mycoemilia scoparia]